MTMIGRHEITSAQFRLIHAAKCELAMNEDTYRDTLFVQAGVRSSKDLDQEGVDKVIRRFKQLGFRMKATESFMVGYEVE